MKFYIFLNYCKAYLQNCSFLVLPLNAFHFFATKREWEAGKKNVFISPWRRLQGKPWNGLVCRKDLWTVRSSTRQRMNLFVPKCSEKLNKLRSEANPWWHLMYQQLMWNDELEERPWRHLAGHLRSDRNGEKKQKEELKKGKDTKRGKEKCSLQKHFRWLSLSQGWACKSCRKVLQMWDGGHSWLGEHSWEVPASAFQVRNPSKDNPPGAPSSCSCLWGEQAAASSGREAESHTHHLLSSNILRISTRITTPSSWVTHTAGRKGWQKWPQGCLGDTLGHLGIGGAG